MKKSFFAAGRAILSAATIPMWFIEIFEGVGHLPDQNTGEIVRVTFYHSMLENVSDALHPLWAYVAIAFALVSALVNTAALMRPHNNVTEKVSNIVFGVAMTFFFLLLLSALTVARGY